MDDTPYINDGADASLRKTVSLLNKIEAKTGTGGDALTDAQLRASPVPVDIGGSGSITITSGTVTVSNEVEVTNDSGNPIPVSGNVTADVNGNDWETIGGQIADGLSGYTIPVGIAGRLSVNVTQFDATDVVVEAKGRDINDDLQSLPIGVNGQEIPGKGIPIAFGKGPEFNSTIVSDQGNGLPVSNSTASNLKAQSQLLDSSGTVVDYATIGTAGTPSVDVVTVQGISGGVSIPVTANVEGNDWETIGGQLSNGLFGVTVPVSVVGTIEASTGLTQPLTDAQLRASEVPVSGPLTDTQLRASAVPVSGTFWQATQPISGSVSVSNFPATQAVSGTVTANTGLTQPLTDAQLRATAVPISNTSLTNIDVDIGATSDSAATSDTGTFSLIALVKRLLGKLPSLSGGRIPVDGSGVTQPVSLSSAISQRVQGWDIPIHDYRALGYTSGNLTSITYKTGGASGTTVATLTLVYDGGGNLTSMTKT